MKETILKNRPLIAIICASILPLLFSTIWIIKNTQLPTADSANYLLTGINIYYHFHDQGFWNGLLSCYLERGWRPILFPILAVPFLLISHGNMLLAYDSIIILSIGLSVIYVYLLFRLQLDRISAIIATNIVGLLPLIQAQVLGFFAESILFPCVIGCIYHLIKSNYMREKKHVGGFILLFTLAIMMRPVEAAMNLIIVLSVFLFLGLRQQVFNAKSVIATIGVCFTGLFIFLASFVIISYIIPSVNQPDSKMLSLINALLIITAISSLLIWLIVFFMRQYHINTAPTIKYQHNNLLILAFAITVLLVLAWFLPFSSELFEWIYRTSLGDIAASTGLGTGKLISPQHSFLVQLDQQVRIEGRVVVIGITIFALAEILMLLKARSLKQAVSLPVIYLLSISPLPMLEVFLTVQDWPRKISITFPALLMALMILVLQRKSTRTLRMIYFALLLILQFILLVSVSINKTTYNPLLDYLVGYYTPAPVTTRPNPHDVVESFLTTKAKKYNLKSIGIEVNPNTMEPVDPFLLSMIVQAKNRNYSVSFPYFASSSSENLLQLKQKFDGIFLSQSLNKMIISPSVAKTHLNAYMKEKSSSIKTFDELLVYFSKNQLASIGWKLGPCITIKSACLIEPVTKGLRQADCLGCLLLPINKKS